MKRSLHVSAPLLAAAALALNTGCRQTQMARCVDEQNRVVDDKYCDNPEQYRFVGPYGTYGPIYRPYYGGGGSYFIGSTATGGSYSPSSGESYATSTSRGGFGSSFAGSGSGGAHGSGSGA
jgi:hypothetical protein